MRLAETWELRMKKEGNQFAQIRTIRAIHDRCCIVRNLPKALMIQFIKRKQSKGGRGVPDFIITQETIQKRDIVGNIRYYQD